jgi:hypothetical protein
VLWWGENGVKTIDFSFAHQWRKTSRHITRMMDKIIITIYILLKQSRFQALWNGITMLLNDTIGIKFLATQNLVPAQ